MPHSYVISLVMVKIPSIEERRAANFQSDYSQQSSSRVISHARTAGRIEHAQQTQLAFARILYAMQLSFGKINT